VSNSLITFKPWKHVGFGGGYQVLYQDYSTGSRNNRFSYDATNVRADSGIGYYMVGFPKKYSFWPAITLAEISYRPNVDIFRQSNSI
jgi:hypothetical protein